MRLRRKRELLLARLSLPLFYAELCMAIFLFWLAIAFVEFPRQNEFERSDFQLPYAPPRFVVENPDCQRLVLVVLRDGTMYISGRPQSDAEVRQCIEIEARLSREHGTGLSNRLVLIAADQRTPFQHVRKIINWCRDPDIRIWRLAFAGREIPPWAFADE